MKNNITELKDLINKNFLGLEGTDRHKDKNMLLVRNSKSNTALFAKKYKDVCFVGVHYDNYALCESIVFSNDFTKCSFVYGHTFENKFMLQNLWEDFVKNISRIEEEIAPLHDYTKLVDKEVQDELREIHNILRMEDLK